MPRIALFGFHELTQRIVGTSAPIPTMPAEILRRGSIRERRVDAGYPIGERCS